MQNLFKLINILFPLRDFLYILQFEEYEFSRFLTQIRKRIFKRGAEKQGKLIWTVRIQIVALTTVLLYTAYAAFSFLFKMPWLLLITPFIVPLLVAVSSQIVTPLILFGTRRKMKRAYTYFKKHNPHTKVIAITGSFGKTTTKYLLYDLLRHTYDTSFIPDNINTALGIADFILQRKVAATTEYFIVEMGAYKIGDIAAACRVVRPDISLITALGDQHIERFGSFSNLVAAKNEIFSASVDTHNTFAPQHVCVILKEHNLLSKETQCIALENKNEVPFLEQAPEMTSNVSLAVAVGKMLGVTDAFIADTLYKFKPPERRKQILSIDTFEVIDASYNISPAVAQSTIENAYAYALKRNKELLVITGGIPEQGTNAQNANIELGKLLDAKAACVILANTEFAKWIASGLSKIEPRYEIDPARIIHSLRSYGDPKKHVVLLLPTLPDQYYL